MSKLGLNYEELLAKGLAYYNNAYIDLTDENAYLAIDLTNTDIKRELNLNYDSKEAYKEFVERINDENCYEALIVAFAKMIQENNVALQEQLTTLGVLRNQA